MNQHHDMHPGNDHAAVPKPPRSGRRWMIAAAIATAIAATGLAGASMAGNGPGFGQHGHGRQHGPVDATTASRHIEKMVAWIVGDGTPQQKARLTEIAKSAFADLHGTRAEYKAANARIHALLMQTAIDRVALEQVRGEQMALLDKVSKRMLTAVEDAAEVLTPEQRLRFSEQMKKRMRR